MRTILEWSFIELIRGKWEDIDLIYRGSGSDNREKIWLGLGTITNILLSHEARSPDLHYPELPPAEQHLVHYLREDLPLELHKKNVEVIWLGATGRGKEIIKGSGVPTETSIGGMSHFLAKPLAHLYQEDSRPAVAGIFTLRSGLIYLDAEIRQGAIPQSIMFVVVNDLDEPFRTVRRSLVGLATERSI